MKHYANTGAKHGASSVPPLKQLRSLLVPLDLTPISDRVLARLALLPLADEARLSLLHVVPDTLPADDRLRAERQATTMLAKEARHLQKALPKSMRIVHKVVVGTPHKEIAAAARAQKAELIVMGRGSGRALRDLFLGATSERVIRESKLPVLVVRLPARAAYGRPAFALDLDKVAYDVVRVALRVISPRKMRVSVIHAFSPPFENLGYSGVPESAIKARRRESQIVATGELSKLLASALTKANATGDNTPVWKLVVRHGSARMVIEKVVEQADTDLLVLGTRGYAGIAHVFLGTIAGDVLRAVACDVLIVPPSRR